MFTWNSPKIRPVLTRKFTFRKRLATSTRYSGKKRSTLEKATTRGFILVKSKNQRLAICDASQPMLKKMATLLAPCRIGRPRLRFCSFFVQYVLVYLLVCGTSITHIAARATQVTKSRANGTTTELTVVAAHNVGAKPPPLLALEPASNLLGWPSFTFAARASEVGSPAWTRTVSG